MKELIHFTNKELKAVKSLLILIVLAIIVRVCLPLLIAESEQDFIYHSIAYNSEPAINSINEPNTKLNDVVQKRGSITRLADNVQLNPNTASFDEFRLLGLNSFISNNIVRYRDKGGEFTKIEDLYTIYGIDSIKHKNILKRFKFDAKLTNMTISKDTFAVVEINSASIENLKTLPGIGEKFGTRIVKYRNLLGGYYSINQLKEVYGLNDSVFTALHGLISIDTTLISKLDVNRCNITKLHRHPYISEHQARAIINYRNYKGRIENMEGIKGAKVFTDSSFRRVLKYLKIQS